MPMMPTNTDVVHKLTHAQIETIYLEIQSKIGVLLCSAPPVQIQEKLKNASSILLRVKREWIGYRGEITG